MKHNILPSALAPDAIKFKTGAGLDFTQTLRMRVDAYFKNQNISMKANPEMVVKTIILIAAYIIPFILIILLPLPYVAALLMWFIMGVAVAGIGMSVMHDANHGAYSSDEKTNRYIGMTLNLLGGSVLNWKVQHNMLHHTYTNITGLDEDIDSKSLLRLSPHAGHMPIQKGQWWYAFFFYSFLTLYWVLAKDLVKFYAYRTRGLLYTSAFKNNLALVRILVLKTVYFLTMIGLPVLMGVPFYQVITGFLLLHATAGIILSVIFQLAHSVEGPVHPLPDETGQMEDTWVIHQMRTTMNFSPRNKLLSWYVGGLNFQVEHHLFSRICHIHYPAIAPIVRQTAEEFGVPYLEYPTFAQAFRSHIRLLKTFGRMPLDEIMG